MKTDDNYKYRKYGYCYKKKIKVGLENLLLVKLLLVS